MNKRQRITKSIDFALLKRSSRHINCGSFILLAYRRPQDPDLKRLGVVASRKVGNAVIRNRAKRVFREIFRLNQKALPQSSDIIIIVRKTFINQSFRSLQAKFIKVCTSLTP